MLPELARAPASGGDPVGPDADLGGAGIVEIGADTLIRKQGVRSAAKAEDVLRVGAAVRGQTLHPVEVGLHAFPQVALHSTCGLHVDGGVDLACDADRKSTRLNSSHLGISYAVF